MRKFNAKYEQVGREIHLTIVSDGYSSPRIKGLSPEGARVLMRKMEAFCEELPFLNGSQINALISAFPGVYLDI